MEGVHFWRIATAPFLYGTFMSDAGPTDARLDVTDVRFSLRSMLIVMAVVAVVATLFGAYLRQFPGEARPRLLAYWGLLFALLGGLFCYHARKRLRAEKKAGRVFFQLVPHSYFLRCAPHVASLMIGSAMLTFAPLMWLLGSEFIADPNSAQWKNAIDMGAIYAVFASGAGITYLCWQRRIRICKNGVVVRTQIVPWASMKRFYWDACNRDVVVLESGRSSHPISQIAVRVPPDQREAVENLLRENLLREKTTK